MELPAETSVPTEMREACTLVMPVGEVMEEEGAEAGAGAAGVKAVAVGVARQTAVQAVKMEAEGEDGEAVGKTGVVVA